MNKKEKTIMKFPKVIYVQAEENDESRYFWAWETPEEADDGKVAIYELKEIKIKETETKVVLKEQKRSK